MPKQNYLHLLHEDVDHKLQKQQYLSYNQHLIKNKTVLDLACHDGISTSIIKELGASFVYGVEARKELVEKAKTVISGNVSFFVGDIQDKNLVAPLVNKSQSIVMLGVFYHLYDHFGLFSQILRPNIDHVLIETVAGPETVDPAMAWGFEKTDGAENGWHPETKYVPHGTPNLAWIFKSAECFGFYCDWVHSYAVGGELPAKTRYNITQQEYSDIKHDHWPPYEKIKSNEPLANAILQDIKTKLVDDGPEQAGNKRHLIRLYNARNVKADPVKIEDCFIWRLHQKQSKARP
jgi:SAM-dependent methyltransferase